MKTQDLDGIEISIGIPEEINHESFHEPWGVSAEFIHEIYWD